MAQRLSPVTVVAALLAALASGATAAASESAFDNAVASSKSAMMGDPKAALGFAQVGLTLADHEAGAAQRAIDIATARWLQGEALIRLDRADEARPILDEALKTAMAASPNSKLHADLLMAEGKLMAADGKVQVALADLQAAYRIFGAVGQPRGQAKALQDIGSIYQDAGDYPRVLKYYEESADLYSSDPALLVAAYNNIANAYKEQHAFPAAEAGFRRALAVASDMKSPVLQTSILENLASTQVEDGHYGAAAQSVAAGLRASGGNPADRPFFWGISARAALKQGQVQTARELLDRMFRGVDPTKTGITYRDFHRTAYETYSRLGEDHLALAHLTALKRLDDQARSLAASTNSALMSAQFDYANQMSRIGALKAGQFERDMQLARSRNTIQVILLAAAGAIMCLLTGAILWIRRGRNAVRRANAQLKIVNRSLEKALQARSEFLATTSHEIRTPLNGILGMTQILLANRAVDPAVRDQIRLVHSSGEAMRDLVNDILDVAKIESGKLEIEATAFDLHAMLAEVVDLWMGRAREKGLALSLEVVGAPRTIIADRARLKQIVTNLVSNGLKFTDTGHVKISALPEAQNKSLTLTVEDTGIGIAPEHVDRVFETFSQIDSSISRLYAGTGLGLSICKSIAETMGGAISLVSRVGEGSTFKVVVPISLPLAGVAVVAAPASSAEGLGQASVMIVEPNLLAQSILRAMFDRTARSVEAVASPALAIETLRSRPSDVLIVDLAALSADGEPPMVALQDLAGCRASLLAVLAPQPSADDIVALRAHGADVVISKPISGARLIAQIENSFATRTQDSGTPRAEAHG